MESTESNSADEADQSTDEPAASSMNASSSVAAGKSKKRRRPISCGIVYLSSIPYRLTVGRIRETLSQYGELGRVYLQSEVRMNAAGKKERNYTEGWIEFKDKRIAKRVAVSLNNTPVGGRRRSKAHDSLWNMKYLHRFKWIHLNEQLAYEKAVHQQRMRTEISQAKRQAQFFTDSIEKGKHLRRLEQKVLEKGGLWERYQRQIVQKKAIQKPAAADSEATSGLLRMVFASANDGDK